MKKPYISRDFDSGIYSRKNSRFSIPKQSHTVKILKFFSRIEVLKKCYLAPVCMDNRESKFKVVEFRFEIHVGPLY
jgi:hypothetical protein